MFRARVSQLYALPFVFGVISVANIQNSPCGVLDTSIPNIGCAVTWGRQIRGFRYSAIAAAHRALGSIGAFARIWALQVLLLPGLFSLISQGRPCESGISQSALPIKPIRQIVPVGQEITMNVAEMQCPENAIAVWVANAKQSRTDPVDHRGSLGWSHLTLALSWMHRG